MMEVMDESSLEEELEEADKVGGLLLPIFLLKQEHFAEDISLSTISRHLRPKSLGTLWAWELALGQAFFLW